MKNTLENKANFLLFQYAQNRNSIKSAKGDGVVFGVLNITNNPEDYYFEGTPLSQITDEDAIEVIRLWLDADGYSMGGIISITPKVEFKTDRFDAVYITSIVKHKTWADEQHSLVINRNLKAYIADYLRSKGYALPYNGISVETLIEWGWIKLK